MLGQVLVTGAVQTQREPLNQAWGPEKASQRRNAQVFPLELGGE